MLIYHVKHIIVISEERQFVKNYAIFSFVLEDKNTPKEKNTKTYTSKNSLSLSLTLSPAVGRSSKAQDSRTNQTFANMIFQNADFERGAVQKICQSCKSQKNAPK